MSSVENEKSSPAQSAGVTSLTKEYDRLLNSRPGMLDSEHAGGELKWLHKARMRDADRWQRIGIPTRQSERWKYTSLTSLENAHITLSVPPLKLGSRAKYLSVPGAMAEAAFLNGRFVPEWSNFPASSAVKVIVLSKLIEDCVASGWTKERLASLALFRKHIETSDVERETSFASMNTSFMQDAALVLVQENAVLERPIVISFFTDAANPTGELGMSVPRLFVHLEKFAQASVVQCFSGETGADYLTNAVADLRLDEGSRLCHCKIQLEAATGTHIGTTRIHQSRNSKCETHQLSLGAKLSREDLHISLEEAGAEAYLGGLYMVEGTQHADNYTQVDHVSPHTTSAQVYKGILDGESRAVFNGHVRIMRDAQKSNASQLNNNLLLSKKAEVDTRPELEIDADDVKASHGATIGQIDPEHVFYMQTRAVSKEEAVRSLSQGFARDIAFRIENVPARELVMSVIDQQFGRFRLGGKNV